VISLILAWLFFVVGASSSLVFLAGYVWLIRPWQRRDGEPKAVRRVRADILAWSGTVGLLYLSSVIALAALRTHPSTAPDRMVISALVAALTTHRLVTFIRVNRRDTP
jgi:hypothetical protein